ncbi:MAG TPA: hypothetical protein EYP07_17210 [Kiloniellaceae bacterium]|nr:hypothetical protein [Kiloniellaceae bacterium]
MRSTVGAGSRLLFTAPVLAVAVSLLASATLVEAQAGENRPHPAASDAMKLRPLPPKPAREVFVRSKPHVNVGAQRQGLSKLKARPGRPTGPGSFTAPPHELADWYRGEGSGPGGYAECTDDLIASCSGTYKPPGTNGPEQTWGMCHESTG